MTREQEVSTHEQLVRILSSSPSPISGPPWGPYAKRIADLLIERGMRLSAGPGLPREPSEAAIEAARRAMVKWDCADTKRWLVSKWKVSEAEAQAMIGEALLDLGGSSGMRAMVRVMLDAAYAL